MSFTIKKKTFRELVEDNRAIILKDKNEIERIYRRIDEKATIENKKNNLIR
ncbi:FbpB family small basic protein [Peribacillus tepidiphilus]|uniref:FbpB family small basic protein n=1 Tax=Peribacillus tepidiphilus TaxID=2652445 RepID=UPI0035B55129